MKTDDIRETFLSFFEQKGHRRMASASLIPQDPTVLLNIAGMLPFVPYFNGDAQPPHTRLVSAQKCVRTNDIENVGRTARHLSFFEMLGNFSFGDYFKREAIRWAWQLSVDEYGLDPERIWASAHNDDDEAVALILEETDIPMERIQRFDSDNFWWTGQAGPAGHCAEFFYDKGPAFGAEGGPAADDERFVEYYNCVFTEFICDDKGKIVGNLPAKNVDTGLGLERLATILQDVPTLYETDLFVPLLAKASELTGVKVGAAAETDVSLKVMAEHARSTAFLIADGVLPAKEGRGYVLRSLLRRLVRHARLLGTTEPVVPALIGTVMAVMGDAYPDLLAQSDLIMRVATAEESDFARVVDQGLARAEAVIAKADGSFGGAAAFELHDTFGFPIDLTEEIARDAGLKLDRDAFNELMQAQRQRARAAAKKGGGDGVPVEYYREAAATTGPTEFLGYDNVKADSTLAALVSTGGLLTEASEGDEFEVILPRTPFYAEGGGQVGDRGILVTPTGRLEVLDTQNAIEGVTTHRVRVVAGEVSQGQDVEALVDGARRVAVARSHSATHVLHATIKEVLGEHAQQAGSLVTPGRLRFDFPHFESVTADALAQIEETVNERVLANPSVVTEIMGIEDAKKAGAVANFGDKYGETVRVVTIGASKELCGGTHVTEGSVIGSVHVVREESIGSNTRRIEALTGIDAFRHAASEMLIAQEIGQLLGVRTGEAIERVHALMGSLKSAEKQLADVRRQALLGQAGELAASADRDGSGLAIVTAALDGVGADDLRALANDVKSRLGEQAIVVLGARTDDGKALLICTVSKDLADKGVQARPILHPAAQVVGGGAGGKGDMAQAGGKDGSKLDEALRVAADQARAAVSA